MRTVRSFACEQDEARRFDARLEETLRLNKKKCFAYVGYAWISELSESVVLVAVLVYAGHLAVKGMLSTAQVTAFLLYQLQLGETFYVSAEDGAQVRRT